MKKLIYNSKSCGTFAKNLIAAQEAGMKKFFTLLGFTAVMLVFSSTLAPSLFAAGDICYVDLDAGGSNNGSSWSNAFIDLQSALGDPLCAEVWVAEGTYYPTSGSNRTIKFWIPEGVEVYGGFDGSETLRDQRDYETNLTILSGDIGTPGDDSDNTAQVVAMDADANTMVLDGFTITKGNANAGGPHVYGGGMSLDGGASPTLRNLIIIDNKAQNGGGGVALFYGSPTFINVVFENNSSSSGMGGGMFSSQPSEPANTPTLIDVTFKNNSANTGGGLQINTNSNVTANRVVFESNSASSGGGVYIGGSSTSFSNATFYQNAADNDGGGIFISKDESQDPLVKIEHATFHGNTANNGGGIFSQAKSSHPLIRNSILWGNTAVVSGSNQIGFDGETNPTLNDSAVQGGCPAGAACDTILTSDPLLGTFGDHGGYTETIPLLASSPAIDTANPAYCPDTDQRGYVRPVDGDSNASAICDMGAYEFGSAAPTPTATATATSTNTPSATHTPSATATATLTPTSTATATLTLTPSSTATATLTPTPSSTATPLTFSTKSSGSQDGYILEKSETSNTGGSMNSTATTIYLGDDKYDKQYIGILSFDTKNLPEGAVIVSATIKIKRSTYTGTNPFSTHGKLYCDLKSGSFGTASLALADFGASASLKAAGTFTYLGSSWYSATLTNSALSFINTNGLTQCRLRFAKDDNDDKSADILHIISGNTTTSGNKPVLTVQYYDP
jgi:predicted outer membrane repeat protein